jgi:hypothetical protein
MSKPTKLKDRRSPLAKARDEFLEHWRGARLCEPDANLSGSNGRVYLMARIIKAWLAGATWGQAHPFPRGGGRTNRRTSVHDYHGAPPRANPPAP